MMNKINRKELLWYKINKMLVLIIRDLTSKVFHKLVKMLIEVLILHLIDL
jgi:hypothetical protein